MGNFLAKRDEHYYGEQGFGFDGWNKVHVDNRFEELKRQVCCVTSEK